MQGSEQRVQKEVGAMQDGGGRAEQLEEMMSEVWERKRVESLPADAVLSDEAAQRRHEQRRRLVGRGLRLCEVALKDAGEANAL